MDGKLTFEYDEQADILYITKRSPYAEQDSTELGDDIVARMNPVTREIGGLEILFFSRRSGHPFELPVIADLRPAR